MARVLAVANLKGGVAKTTTVLALGDCLAAAGQRVLLVDLDPQANLTVAAGVDPAAMPATIYTALLHYRDHLEPLPLAGYRQTIGDRLDLLPANLTMIRADQALAGAKRQEYLLDEALAPARAEYDVILIDCQPSMSLLTTTALTAAPEVLVPLAPEYLAVQGLALLFEQIYEVRQTKLNPTLAIVGVLLTLTDFRTTHNREMADHVLRFVERQTILPQRISVLGEIKRSIRAAEAAEAALPVTRYAPTSDVARAYVALAERLMVGWGLRPRVAAASGGGY
jgi:chromosome partitioning protein